MSNKWGSHLRGTFSGRLARSLRARRASDDGASLVEYALLLALIAVVAIGALTFLGKTVSGTLNNVGNDIALGGSGGAQSLVFYSSGTTTFPGSQPYSLTGANFQAGVPGTSYQFLASGSGPTNFSLSNSNLPSTLTLTSTGLLSGTPTATGTYTFTVTASNASGTGSAQFTLTVAAATAPAFSSPSQFSATFVVGTNGTVSFAASPATAITESGTLPSGVTFTGGTTTATLSGTPNAGSGRVYNITVTAANGSTTNPQSFTLTVDEANGKVTPNAGSMTDETASTITLSALGFPAPTISLTSGNHSLPSGVTFTGGNGTATLTIGSGGSSQFDCYQSNPPYYPQGQYALTFKSAANGVTGSSDQTTNFTLTMNCNSSHQ